MSLSKKAEEKKYEQTPSPDQANWMLVSMGDMSRLKSFLVDFRKPNAKIGYVGSRACSSTLIWTGTKGNNVPVSLFGGNYSYPFGFSLDPSKIIVPHAEFKAIYTGSVVPTETPKTNLAQLHTQYPEKKGRAFKYDAFDT